MGGGRSLMAAAWVTGLSSTAGSCWVPALFARGLPALPPLKDPEPPTPLWLLPLCGSAVCTAERCWEVSPPRDLSGAAGGTLPRSGSEALCLKYSESRIDVESSWRSIAR